MVSLKLDQVSCYNYQAARQPRLKSDLTRQLRHPGDNHSHRNHPPITRTVLTKIPASKVKVRILCGSAAFCSVSMEKPPDFSAQKVECVLCTSDYGKHCVTCAIWLKKKIVFFPQSALHKRHGRKFSCWISSCSLFRMTGGRRGAACFEFGISLAIIGLIDFTACSYAFPARFTNLFEF